MSNNDYPGIDPTAMMPTNYNTPRPVPNDNTRAAFPAGHSVGNRGLTNQPVKIPAADTNEHGWKFPKAVLDSAGRPKRPGV